MSGAGSLRERVAFERRDAAVDGYGNTVGEAWTTVAVCAAQVIPIKGGEEVLASRLAGRQPVIIRVRSSSETRSVTTDMRARDVRSGVAYDITAVADMDGRRRYLDIMAVAGTGQ